VVAETVRSGEAKIKMLECKEEVADVKKRRCGIL
jgi:hypothetical protein